MLATIRLEWKWLTVTNTFVYNDIELIKTAKKFYSTGRKKVL